MNVSTLVNPAFSNRIIDLSLKAYVNAPTLSILYLLKTSLIKSLVTCDAIPLPHSSLSNITSLTLPFFH